MARLQPHHRDGPAALALVAFGLFCLWAAWHGPRWLVWALLPVSCVTAIVGALFGATPLPDGPLYFLGDCEPPLPEDGFADDGEEYGAAPPPDDDDEPYGWSAETVERALSDPSCPEQEGWKSSARPPIVRPPLA